MVKGDKDAARVRFPPPLIYLAGIVGGVVLQAFAWKLPLFVAALPRIVLGVSVAITGATIIVSAAGRFRKMGQDPKPWKTTPEITTDGIYRVTRNPMYVGMGLLQVGIGLGLGNPWIVGFVVPALTAVYVVAIRHEEKYLAEKFGDSYLTYTRSVRRWL